MKKLVKTVSALAVVMGLGFASSVLAEDVLPGTYIYSQFASVAVKSVSVDSVTVGTGLMPNKIHTGPLSKGTAGVVSAIVQDAESGSNTPLSAQVTYTINAGDMGAQKCVVNVTSPNVNKSEGLKAELGDGCGLLSDLFHVQTSGPLHPNNPSITVDWKLAK